eukprot:TRINITY_DN19177_c0_g1_i1.p1 TRINITY_DN19177_c0_g1~~TRINITY_DN19177_c0_g1_i1.p1  ORF type:complete len:718 (+),score=266.87 TRINITY_DN19177_c0_g1_i1:328-2481(+)
MSLSLLQMRLKKNEEDFARLNSINFEDEVKDVKKKMPGENNPWSGELKARRKKSRTAEAEDEGEWDENEDWEWEEEEEEGPAKCNGVKNDDKPVDAEGKANITITGNLVTIDRSKVDWSDDEFDEEDDEPETAVPPPPPPPPGPPAPPPPPPGPPGVDKKPSFKSDRVEQLKKKPTKRVDWNDLMQEINKYKCPGGLLKKTVCNDRSRPILSKSKVKGVFVYESEKHSKDADILKEISTGARLKKVRTNDRSKPNLRGIKSFKRQLTKEEKLDKGFSFGDDAFEEVGELEDLEKLKDDLESTKQLLELEVRSKNLLEKDNKKLQAEIERLKSEFSNHKESGDQTPDILNNILTRERKESISKERRESIKEKKKSIIDNINNEVIENTCESEVQKVPVEQVPEEIFEEIDELKEEAEEARKLAEEWEAKYKEMQRQMEMIDGPGGMYGKKNSTAGIERPSFQRMLSTASSDGVEDTNNRASAAFGDPEEDDWMQKREVIQLQTKLRNTKDKKEIIVRERNLLSERIDNLKESIAKEFEARKNLKKDVKDMNAAFKEEMADMEAEEETQKNLEDCYWSDEEDLVKNPYAKEEKENSADDDSAEMADFMDEDDLEESVEEILKSAEECEEVETDPGAGLFNAHFNEDSDTEGEPDANDHVQMSEHLNKRIERESEKVTLMRKSNFALKSKIDILYDILQTQKEKHFDLKQELNRMLSDIQ